MQKVKENDTVKVHYTGKLNDGQVFDSSLQREPLEFKVGEGNMIKGFENAVLGMAVGENKEVNIPSNEAYGPHREELTQEIKKSDLPAEVNPEVGLQLMSRTPDGREFRVVVSEVKGDTVRIDANHPLAGKDLIFEIEVVEIS